MEKLYLPTDTLPHDAFNLFWSLSIRTGVAQESNRI